MCTQRPIIRAGHQPRKKHGTPFPFKFQPLSSTATHASGLRQPWCTSAGGSGRWTRSASATGRGGSTSPAPGSGGGSAAPSSASPSSTTSPSASSTASRPSSSSPAYASSTSAAAATSDPKFRFLARVPNPRPLPPSDSPSNGLGCRVAAFPAVSSPLRQRRRHTPRRDRPIARNV